MAMKCTIFWDITPCSPLKVNQRFEETYCLHLQGRRISSLVSRWFHARLILRPWKWRLYVPPKRRLTSNGLHGGIYQKIVLFILTLSYFLRPSLQSDPLQKCFPTKIVYEFPIPHIRMSCMPHPPTNLTRLDPVTRSLQVKRKDSLCGGRVCPPVCGLTSVPIPLDWLFFNSIVKTFTKSWAIPIFSHIYP
jgi:hypothetical protein